MGHLALKRAIRHAEANDLSATIALYHERWQHEITHLALRRTLLHGRVPRSGDPAGLEQEMWALLTL